MPLCPDAYLNMFSIRQRARSQYSGPTAVAVVSLVRTCRTGASFSNKVSWRAVPYPLICTASSASITCTCTPVQATISRTGVPAGGERGRVGPAPVEAEQDRGVRAEYLPQLGQHAGQGGAQPGRDDTLVVDARGRAVVFGSGEPTGLSSTLPGVLAQLRKVLGPDAPILLGFDRGGAYPAAFTTCRDAGAEWVTY